MSPAQILAFLQIARFAVDTIEMATAGTLTEEERERRWDEMKERLEAANEMWESAG